jgi:hypothetical protein
MKSKRKPSKLGRRKCGSYKEAARSKYTVKPKPERRKVARRIGVKERKGTGVIGLLGGESKVALRKLQEAGFVKSFKKCPFCRRGSLTEPEKRTDKQGDQLWQRCKRYACNRRFNVLRGSKFDKTKLSPAQVALIVKRYTSTDKIVPPAVDDLAGEAESGRFATTEIVEVLRKQEVAVAKRLNVRGQLSGDCEIDEHGVRSYHVSRENKAFQKYHTKKVEASNHKYFLSYFRVIGLRQRGHGKMYMHVLPPKLLPPGSKPPPLSESELLNCKILKRLKKGSVVTHSDGAQAYKSVLKNYFKRLRSRAVSHKDMEFVKKVRPVRLPSGKSSSMTGTQAIDRTWETLDAVVPNQLVTKKSHDINPLLERYCWVWLYRVNHYNKDGFEEMGKYFSK